MFYIDFTSPEGKTYRIDVSKHPVHYECPVCGGITIYTFDEDDEYNCPHCIERKRQQDYDEIDARLYEQLSNRINREYGCHLSPADTKQIIDDPYFGEVSPESLVKQIKKYDSDWVPKQRPRQRTNQHPNVFIIPPVKPER